MRIGMYLGACVLSQCLLFSRQPVATANDVVTLPPSPVSADAFPGVFRRCGTRSPDRSTFSDPLARSVNHCTSFLTSIQDEYWPTDVHYVIPVWFHIIYRSDGLGYITDARIEEQMQVLNDDFGALTGTIGESGFNTRVQFELAGVTRTMNNRWFDEDLEDYYKPALIVDPNKYLNIYTTSAEGYLGYSYFPQGSAGRWWDGVVMLHSAVGGRDNGFYQYNQGRSLVHEIGHYLGLYHTFGADEGSCENSYTGGDLIVDTEAEGSIHYDCTPSWSCGTEDPVDNYMSYSNDLCINKFTPEQANRIVCSLVNYRPNAFSSVTDPDSDEYIEFDNDFDDSSGGWLQNKYIPSFLYPILLFK